MNRFQRSVVIFIIGIVILGLLVKLFQWVALRIQLEPDQEINLDYQIIIGMAALILTGFGALLFNLRMLQLSEYRSEFDEGIVDDLLMAEAKSAQHFKISPFLWVSSSLFIALSIALSLWFLIAPDSDPVIRVFNRDFGAYSVVSCILLFGLLLINDLWTYRRFARF